MRSPGRTSASRLRVPCAAGALAALLLAACGGGSTPAPPPPPPCDVPVVVTAPASWQLFGPTDWNPACATLTVRAPALAADERLALVLVNAGGPDNATPSVGLSGTLAFAAADGAPVVASLAPTALAAPAPDAQPYDRTPLEAGHDLVVSRRRTWAADWLAAGAPRQAPSTARREAAVAAAAPAVGDPAPNAGFCVFSFSTSATTRRPATLRWISSVVDPVGNRTPGHALFYVTDDLGDPANPASKLGRVLAARPDLWTTLESYFEGNLDALRNPIRSRRILPALHESFGTETDVDGNGRLVFLLADLGKTASGGFTVGYFDGNDVVRAADTTPACSAGGSNGADMLYLLDPWTFNSNGYPYDAIVDQELPGTMAHELQHDVTFNMRCLASRLASCPLIDDPAGDLWLNEGLSMVSEDLAGFGLEAEDAGGFSQERRRVGVYLSCRKPSASALCHQDVSLTTWPASGPGDAYGHYGGSHAFLRWHLDQVADPSAFARAVVGSSLASRAALAAASGLSFEEGYARFATAALFSGEDPLFASYPLKPSPDWSFAPAPAPWSPLHTAVGRVGYTALPRPGGAAFVTTLRKDGWGSFVSGRGTGSDATLTITSTAAVKPRAAVVRFRGNLPLPP